jgi:hypothetical protein
MTADLPPHLTPESFRQYGNHAFKKGLAYGHAAATVHLLRMRDVPLEFADVKRICDCTDLDTLERWIVRAATITNVGELFD